MARKYTKVTVETMEDDGIIPDNIDPKSMHTGEPMIAKATDFEGVLITTKNGRSFKRKLSHKDAAALAAEIDAALQLSTDRINF